MKTNRRSLIKALTIGGGAVTVAKLPSAWTTPVVEAVTLPAHAQTTGVSTLSGGTSDINTEVIGGEGSVYPFDFENYAGGESTIRSIAEHMFKPAHAADPGAEVRAEGFAERDFGRGDGWWNVQFLFREEFDIFDQTSILDTAPFPLDKLTSVAYAGGEPVSTCINEGLWKASVKVEESGDSNVATNVPVDDTCGDEEFGPIDMQIQNADDPNNPTAAELVIFVNSGVLTRVPIDQGGGPLSVNCEGKACDQPK